MNLSKSYGFIIFILISLIITSTLIASPLIFAFKNPILKNADQPLLIQTYDGSDQVVHPSIIDFQNEYGIDEWSGYRYWMVLTPYPFGQDQYENPSLYASHDGFKWDVPQNITNPLDKGRGGLDMGFLSDPEMIYNPDTNQIWVYYRFASTEILKMQLIQINPDLTMTKPVIVMDASPWSQNDNKYRSFCIWRESTNRWHMWGGGGVANDPYNTYYFFSTDGFHWGEPRLVLNQDGVNPFQALGLSNWHMSAKPNKKEGRIEFLVYSHDIRPLQMQPFSFNDPIVYAECSMNSPTLFKTPITSPVLLPSEKGWDNNQVYRCTFQIIDDKTRYLYKIWYSAEGKDGKWRLGYTDGYLPTSYSKN
jgi:hypothetical protein